MGAGLPLVILSILALVILVVWVLNGKGSRKIRILSASTVGALLILCWVALLTTGVFHPVGEWGMIMGFVISFCTFFVPVIGNKLIHNENS